MAEVLETPSQKVLGSNPKVCSLSVGLLEQYAYLLINDKVVTWKHTIGQPMSRCFKFLNC